LPVLISTNDKKGNSISNAIIIDAQDTVSGITEEHALLDWKDLKCSLLY
jgi:hypothetical protein